MELAILWLGDEVAEGVEDSEAIRSTVAAKDADFEGVGADVLSEAGGTSVADTSTLLAGVAAVVDARRVSRLRHAAFTEAP